MGNKFGIIESELIYLSFFFACVLSGILAVSYYGWADCIKIKIKKTNPIYGSILLIISALIPCVLAGVRSDFVGADTAGYGIKSFQNAIGIDTLDYISHRREWAFYALASLTSKFTDNEGVWLGIMQAITYAPIVLIAKDRKNSIPISLVIYTYLFRFFNYTLCIMRQSIACSLLLLVWYLFQKKKYIWGFLLSIIVCGIHSTAWVGLLGIISISFLDGGKKSNHLYKTILIGFVLMIIFIIFLPQIANYILYKGFVPTYFMEFLKQFDNQSISRYSIFESTFRLIVTSVLFYILRTCEVVDRFDRTVFLTSMLGGCLYVACAIVWKIGAVYRITEYFDFSLVFSIPLIAKYIKSGVGGRKMVIILILLGLLIYWEMAYMIFPSGLGFRTEYFGFR